MITLQDRERATYEEMWQVHGYANNSPGEQLVPVFLDMSQTLMRGSLLDAGCGTGKGALALQRAGFDVVLCDLTREGLVAEAQEMPFYEKALWSNLTRAIGFKDWVFCADVLEHIPPSFTMLVVQRLLDVARRGVFLSISLEPDNFGVWAGRPLHQSLQSFVAWRDQLSALGRLIEARDLLNTGVYLLEPLRAERS